MYETFRQWLEKWLRLPPEPLDPLGGENTLHVFRASPKYYEYRLLFWKIALAVKAVLALISMALPVVLGFAGGAVGGIVGLLLTVCVVAFLAFGTLVSYITIRLDYEYRWYKTTDRSLRIREGIWLVREMTMTYANIQDISVSQGPLQRMFGIADLKVKTAGGGGGMPNQEQATMFDMHTGYFRGVDNAAEIRDLMLEQLRKLRNSGLGDQDDEEETETASPQTAADAPSSPLDLLRDIHDEARKLRAGACALVKGTPN